jgi:hypothetical protein
MSSTHKPKVSNPKEAGMVAILVTMILMIVISLIVLGFAQISRRNQRQSLDRQLSTQAFYAAETAVNDAADLIKAAVQTGTNPAAKPDCNSSGGGFYATLTPVIDATSDVEYSCLIVDPAPTTLVYSDVGTTSTVVPLVASSGTIASVRLTWQTKDDSLTPATNCPNNRNTLPAAGAWGTCGYGVLRFDLVPTTGGLTHSSLQSATMTAFVIPLRPGAAAAATANPMGYSTGGANNRLGVVCSNANCTLTINGLSQGQYYMRVSSLYKDVSLQIAATSSTGSAVSLQGAQAVIDATGKAQDVLRRIQVRVPLAGSSSNLLSDFAIQSTDAVCKRFAVMDGYFQSSANAAVPGVGAAHATNPLCQ